MTNTTAPPAVINQEKDLQHLSAFKQEILTLKEGYKDLTIDGVEDKDGYEKVRLAIASLRTKRTTADGERKTMGKPYRDTVLFINTQYDEVEKIIKDGPGGELELKEKKQVIDDIEKKIEEDRKRLEEEKINNRINELIGAGMVFDGSYYSIGSNDLNIPETSLGVVHIREMDDVVYKEMLQVVLDKAGKITAEKARLAEIERKANEEKIENDRKEREEFNRKQEEFNKQQEEFNKRQTLLNEQQDRIDKENRDREQIRINTIMRQRSTMLVGLGLEYEPGSETFDYKGETMVADAPGIIEYDDNSWLDFVENLKGAIAQKKIDAEEFLKDQQKKEKDRLELQEKERLAGLSDKQRIQEYTDALLAIPVPELKTKTWKARAGSIRDFITDNRPA